MSKPRPDRACHDKEHNTNIDNNVDDGTDRRPTWQPNARTLRIRALNDELRCRGRGGSIVVTQGVAALSNIERAAVWQAVRDFSAFTDRNDPYGEHDCAVLEVGEITIIWKIDAYERSLRLASPDAADPSVTHRVLTIMLAEEY